MSGKQETGMLRFLERTIISLDIFSITSLVFTFDIFVNVLFCEVFHGIDNLVFVISLIGTTLNSILFFFVDTFNNNKNKCNYERRNRKP